METEFFQQKRLWKQAFGDGDEFLSAFFSTAFHKDRCRFLWEGEDLAAMLYWMDGTYQDQKLAYLYAVATDQAYRGRGLCRKLMEQTHRQLKEEGYAAALLSPATEDLRKMYQSFGYQPGTRGSLLSCGPGEPVEIHRIPAAEFAPLRRQYLPADGVLQEGGSLAFLEKTAEFYRGRDFLLTARKEGDSLVGLELLGNEKAAPGIVRALGCQEGTFRTPGREREMTLYLPLGTEGKKPGYFAYLFD